MLRTLPAVVGKMRSPATIRARFDSKLQKFGPLWRSLNPETTADEPAPPTPPAAVASFTSRQAATPKTVPRNPFLDIIEGRTQDTAICVGGCDATSSCGCGGGNNEVLEFQSDNDAGSNSGSVIASDAEFSDDESNDSVLGSTSSEGEGEWLEGEDRELTKEEQAAEEAEAAADSFIDDGDEDELGFEGSSDDDDDDDSEEASDSDFSMSSPQSARRMKPAAQTGKQAAPIIIDLNTSTESGSSFNTFSSNNSPPLQMVNKSIVTNSNLLEKPVAVPAMKKKAPKPSIDLTQPAKAYEDHFLCTGDSTKKLTPKNRAQHLSAYFSFYNRTVFAGALSEVKVSFSNKLLTTAGITRLRRAGPDKTCAIELSSKVCDDVPRMASTLLHEMCHAGQFLLDNVTKPPHGPAFQKYVSLVNNFYPHLHITTCHNYEIKYSYAWACTMSFCGSVIGRHSRSVDTLKHVCGKCKGKLVEIDAKRYYEDGDVDKEFREKTPVKKKESSVYNLYVKKYEKSVRKELLDGKGGGGKLEKGEVMRELGKRWGVDKESFTSKINEVREKEGEKINKNLDMSAEKENGRENGKDGRKEKEEVVIDVDSEWDNLFNKSINLEA
jgi:predicted SprT family Zn-dependent metalloprotease